MALSASHLLKQEYSQARTRIVIVSIIFIYLLFEEHKLETILVTSIYFLYSIFNIYSIIVQNRESSYRRVFNIIGDLSVMAYVIYIGNYNAIIIYPALLWLIIGYGMRFGVKSLLITLLVSEIALTILMMHDPYWRIQDSITYSIIVSLAGLSMFYLFLIKKMHDANDILEEKVSLRVSEMKHLYLHDSLTSLKNRVALVDDLKEDPISGLILIDINNFHNYNELYGMEIGNKVLKDFSSHLKFSKIARKYELYRIYGDHFILRKISSEINEKILKSDIKEIFTIFQEFKINIENLDDILDIDITIGASLGKENVLKMAEMALKYAKSTKKHYSIYTNDIDNTSYSQEFLVWKKRIKQALISNNIIPVYQAIVDKEGNIVKYEALMRLREENNNIEELISPFFFLDIAIKSKIYPQLTLLMIEKTFKDMKNFGYDFSINLTFEDMINDKIVTTLKNQILKYDIGKQIIFEIVESENIDDFPYAKKFVEEFKKMGVRIAIDDFGTGYSNFTHIFELEPDYLKIDGSLIKDIENDKKSYELVTSIVYFSKSLGIKTIAEFVSSKEIFEICESLGIDQFQGYYFCEPLKSDRVEEYELQNSERLLA